MSKLSKIKDGVVLVGALCAINTAYKNRGLHLKPGIRSDQPRLIEKPYFPEAQEFSISVSILITEKVFGKTALYDQWCDWTRANNRDDSLQNLFRFIKNRRK